MRHFPILLLLGAGLVALTIHTSPFRQRDAIPSAVPSAVQSTADALSTHPKAISSGQQRTGSVIPADTRVEGIEHETRLGMGEVIIDADADAGGELEESGIQIANSEIPGMLAELVEKNDPAEDALKYSLMVRWAKTAPEALAQWAAGLPAEQGRGRVLRQALLIWADSDLEAAITFARGEQSEGSRSELILGLANESLQQDSRRGLELASDLPATVERDELLEKGVMEWAASDSSQVMKWVREIPDTPLREKLTAAAAIGMAENQSYEAASLAANSIQSIQDRDRAIVSILQRWVQSAPATALQWLVQFPDGDLKRSATQSTLATWGARDPDGARGWVNALPPSPMKEWASIAIRP